MFVTSVTAYTKLICLTPRKHVHSPEIDPIIPQLLCFFNILLLFANIVNIVSGSAAVTIHRYSEKHSKPFVMAGSTRHPINI